MKRLNANSASDSPPTLETYYWRHGFVLAGNSFELDRRSKPYRRISTTLIIGLSGSFELESGDVELLTTNAVLLAPMQARRRITARNCDVVICDLAMSTPECAALQKLLNGESAREFSLEIIEPLIPQLRKAVDGSLASDELIPLIQRLTARLTGEAPKRPQFPRAVEQALTIIESTPMDELSTQQLADRVYLSESRLRHVFSKHMHCTISEYLRWNALFAASVLWSKGQPMIEVAVAAGFHDLAHLNRAFNEVFGLNPSEVFRNNDMRLHRCEPPHAESVPTTSSAQ